jgi:hypothetical protein
VSHGAPSRKPQRPQSHARSQRPDPAALTAIVALAAALPLALPAAAAAADVVPLSFGDGKWELQGRGVEVADHEGRKVLNVLNGFAYRRDVSFQDGTIELDVQLTRRRSFVYLAFRMADDREYEEVYLRPHKSGLPDAVQYAPVYQGNSAWQLYHGPGATAAPEFEPGVWTRVRLVLAGRRAALYLGEQQQPALVIPRLAREPQKGSIALRAFLPPGDDRPGPIARFADVRLRPGATEGIPPAAASGPAQGGIVRTWAVSRAFVPKDAGPAAELPGADEIGTFTRVEASESGLVELHRHVKLPAQPSPVSGGRARAAAVARLNVRAAREGLHALDLGFSDEATVFLGGRPLFRADQSYSFDAPRREGLVGFDQARLWLPLRAGDNELAVLVSDGFGGWAIMARFPEPAGLEIEAR